LNKRREHLPVNIGNGSMAMSSKVVAILAPESAPMRRPKADVKERIMLVDATQRSIVITDSDHVILSAVQVEPLAQRFFGGDAE
jgi:extracellular matrix regulatory protein A